MWNIALGCLSWSGHLYGTILHADTMRNFNERAAAAAFLRL